MNYKDNETVTISLARYDEFRGTEAMLQSVRQSLHITATIGFAPVEVETSTAKEQIEKICAVFGYKAKE